MHYLPAYIEIGLQEATAQIVPIDVYYRDVSQGVIRLQAFRDERSTSPLLSLSTENGYIRRIGSITHPIHGEGLTLHLLVTPKITQGKALDNAYILEIKHTLNDSPLLIAKGLLYINRTLSTDHD
jgi:hypothetical protein